MTTATSMSISMFVSNLNESFSYGDMTFHAIAALRESGRCVRR